MQTAMIAFAFLVSACSSGAPAAPRAAASVVDDLGRQVGVADSVTRVISLLPAATQMIQALGATDLIVARIDEEVESEVASLPSVGLVLYPSIERIVSMRPDLVIAWAGAEGVVARLEAAGVTVYGARIDRLPDVGSSIRRIGILLGRATMSDSLVRHIEFDLEALRRANENKYRPSVFYVIETDPLWTAGRNTFITDLIEAAGGRNVFEDLAAKWSQVSVEALLEHQPDIIILPGTAAATKLHKQPGWSDLNAVRSRSVFVVDPDVYNRPGPHITRAARELSALLHRRTNR